MGRYNMAALHIFTELMLYALQDKEQIFAPLVHQEASKRTGL